MKTKSRIILSSILAAIFVMASVCLGVQLFTQKSDLTKGVYDGAFTAFADGQATDEIGEIRGMISVNKDYLLLATELCVANANDYSAIGYEIKENGGTATDYSSDTYYTGITVKTGEEAFVTYYLQDVFGAETTAMGMIVAEIEYEAISAYEITPYVVSKTAGKLYGTAQTLDATEETYTLTLTGATVTSADEKANPTPVTTSGEGEAVVNTYAFAAGTDVTVQAVAEPDGKMFVGFDADGVVDNRVGELGVSTYNFTMPAEADAYAAVFHEDDTTFFSTGTFRSSTTASPEGMTATAITDSSDADLEGLSGYSFVIPANAAATDTAVNNLTTTSLSTWGIDQSKLVKFILKNHGDVAVTVEIQGEYFGAFWTTGNITVPANSVVVKYDTIEIFLGKNGTTDMGMHVREDMTGNAGETVQLDVVASMAKKYAERPSDLIVTGGEYMQYGEPNQGVEDGASRASGSNMDLLAYDTYGAMYFWGTSDSTAGYARIRGDMLGDNDIWFERDTTYSETFTFYVKATNLNCDRVDSKFTLAFTRGSNTLSSGFLAQPTIEFTEYGQEVVFKVELKVSGSGSNNLQMGLKRAAEDATGGKFNVLIQIATTNIFGELTA